MNICLDLGCGIRKHPSDTENKWLGVDIRAFDGVDCVLNIGTDILPFEDNSIHEIQAIHVFEHFLDPSYLFFAIDECWRV